MGDDAKADLKEAPVDVRKTQRTASEQMAVLGEEIKWSARAAKESTKKGLQTALDSLGEAISKLETRLENDVT